MPVHISAARLRCLQGQTEIASHGAFFGVLSACLPARYKFRKISVNRRNVLKVSDGSVVLKLRNVVGAKFVHLRESRRIPVGIEVHERGKGAFAKPTGFNGGVR